MALESFDPSMNVLHRRSPELKFLFSPQTIAVVGASEKEKSVGRTLMQNLRSFKGKVFPVNPKRPSVLGVKAYPDLKSIPEKVELVVIVTPAKTVPGIIEEAAALKIPAAIIISAGFKEMGPEGEALEKKIQTIAKDTKMRIVGPNCLGLMNPLNDVNATFAASMALKGEIAFLSQSGALCTAVLDWSLKEKLGFSAFVSIGSMLDVGWGDLIDYFGSDPNTKSILIYMESIGDARAFLSAAREVSLHKPIVLIKAGKSEESKKAAASHTGSLAGSDEALSAALRRVGVLRVNTIAELFSLAEALAKQPLPKGARLSIVTNAGGPGVIATDALIESGGKLASLSAESMESLNAFLPAAWSRNNPIDILGDAGAETYAKAVEIALQDPGSDAALVILTPQDMTEPELSAERLKPFAKSKKPLLASWMGAKSVEKGEKKLKRYKIPTFSFPDLACKTFGFMWRYQYSLQGIYEVPESPIAEDMYSQDRQKKVEAIIEAARKEKRTLLDEVESKKILELYQIPCTPTKAAKDAEQAARLAEEMGYPVVLKVYSKAITHKSDVGGVKLNIRNAEGVRKAFEEISTSVQKLAPQGDFLGVSVQPMVEKKGFELILGSAVDEQFGPVLLFGSGGEMVEIYKDRALAIPPLTTTLAKRFMERTKIYSALHGFRGKKAVDLQRLEQVVVNFSNLVCLHPWIKECDINPLIVSGEEIIAVDGRVILHDLDKKLSDLPRLAIRPLPIQYRENWVAKEGSSLIIRPIRPEDEPKLVRFHKNLSLKTVRQRYLKTIHYKKRVAHERLLRICFNDYDREIALLVEKGKEVIGIIRLSKVPNIPEAFLSVTIIDTWQNKGIGTKLMEKIIKVAEAEKLTRLKAEMLKENFQMKQLCKRFGFTFQEKEKTLLAEKTL